MVLSRALSRLVRQLLSERQWDRLRHARADFFERVLFERAHLYRHTLLRRVTFIGITGSAGKTATKELLAAILATRLAGHRTPGNLNVRSHIPRTILEVRRWHDFCVLEIAGNIKPLERPLALARPRIGVVTTVGTDHLSAFRTIEAVAAAKSRLIACLPTDGTAVLNADDPRVLAMRTQCRGRVMTYGISPAAQVRAEDIQGRWPDRLSFTVIHGEQSYRVQTQLCGVHWVPSVLAALTAALAMDVPLAAAVEAVATVPPYRGRMSPVLSPDRVTFIRDDVKAPLWSVSLALQFLKDARAPRKILVMGTISDYLGASGPKYVAVARQALEAADHVVFVGPRAATCLKAKRHPTDSAYAAPNIDAARQHLGRLLRPGDLVLLKGSRADELHRLVDVSVAPAADRLELEAPGAAQPAGHPVHVIVGLGNPDESYRDTPHNVGQRALELVAATVGASWTAADEALVARVDHPAGTCYLVKPLTKMNFTGPALRHLADQLGFAAEHCILLHDDIDLPIGAVRARMSGGDGGHRGVRSVLEAFQSNAARRVKIGVGPPTRPAEAARHVLAPFNPAELAGVDQASAEAAARALELAGIPRRRHADP